MAITGVLGALYKADGVSTAITDQATLKNADFTRWTIIDKSKRFLDDSVAITVKKNTVVQTTGFTIEEAGGVVVFNPAILTSDVVTVTGKSFTSSQVLTAFQWKMDIQKDIKEVTTFQSNGWKENIAGIGSWSASSDGYWADGSFASLLGQRLIMQFYVDDTSFKRYEGYVVIKKNSIDEAVDGVVKESIDMEGTGEIYYHEG